ncbi:MAG: tRNA lysidine(34) synthetase TilS [Bdellovibrionales bacterium]|nr:tRNA lysidine(34) synthetase TilS [Bdellovibrionales bacterium]
MKSKHFLFHHVLKQFRVPHIKGGHLLVAVSGGVDSMALLSLLLELKRVVPFSLSVVHVHHGSESKKQKIFQDQAAKTVEQFCVDNDIFLFKKGIEEVCRTGQERALFRNALPVEEKKRRSTKANRTGINSKIKSQKRNGLKENNIKKWNEAVLRKYRYQLFSHCVKKSKADYLVLAHTANDLLETRLIRLIRGTGGQGLTAMSFECNRILRPFIHVSRSQVISYAKKVKLKWCEDPSNRSTEYSFRNWIRYRWLPQLEQKRPGSVEAVFRSLDVIAYMANSNQKEIKKIYKNIVENKNVRRDFVFFFPVEESKKILAYYMREQGFSNYRSEHILELIKQMRRPQKNFTFSLLEREWEMSARWLQPMEKK